MLYIISDAARATGVSGPRKVVDSVLIGLKRRKLPFELNHRPRVVSGALWIHDSIPAVWDFRRWSKRLIGPNCFVLPRDCPKILFRSALLVQPSQWSYEVWRQFGIDSQSLWMWPAGIDASVFTPRAVATELDSVMVYAKERSESDVMFAVNMVKRANLRVRLIRYGCYLERDYVEALKFSKFVIWVGRYESQGIALQEALCCNVPVLVWDCTTMGQQVPFARTYFPRRTRSFPCTSAPYFSGECGRVVRTAEDLVVAFLRMQQDWRSYQPRRFVLSELDLEQRAEELFWKTGAKSEGSSSVVISEPYKPSIAARLFARGVRLRWRLRGRLLR